MNTEDEQFYIMPLEELHIKDLLLSIADDKLVALVDEEAGGVIAYILVGNESSLMAHITGSPEYTIVEYEK